MSEQSKPRSNWVIIAAVGAAGVLLSICMAAAGFAAGRMTTPAATPETITETVTELLEVTREVEVPVTVEVEVDAGESAGTSQETEGAGESGSADEAAGNDDQPAEAPEPPPTKAPDQPAPNEFDAGNVDFAVFYEVWGFIESEYDGAPPPDDDLLYSAIEGSLETLDDSYTRFIRPDVAALLRETSGGSVEGIGAFVRENEEGFVEIVRPIDGQPADLAGLMAGDIIIAVDGESIIGMTLDEVVLLVRGPRGTAVILTIARPGVEEPLEFTIVRTRFEVPIIEAEMLRDNIAYVRLTEFNRNAEEKVLAALDELLAQNPQGLIFDLRDNPGGFLDQSVAVADIFLPENVVLYERNNRGLDQSFTADNGDIAETIPLVVLVNAGSASASEIVAGAIQDNGRAILIGETTFGKGSVQLVHQLSDGSELRVTIARWYTPANNSIDQQGITPDIEVPSSADLGGPDDAQLQRAIEYILTGQ